jgi:hypothetical protein
MWVNMAFGQTAFSAFYPWGVAPGYGDERPSAKRYKQHIPCRRTAVVGQIDRLQFAVNRIAIWLHQNGMWDLMNPDQRNAERRKELDEQYVARL